MNKHSNIIINFPIRIKLKTKLIKQPENPYWYHDMNLRFEKFFNTLTHIFDDHVPIKKISKKEKSLIDRPWIDNYLKHLMRVRDACFMKYCRTKKAIEKLKIYMDCKI